MLWWNLTTVTQTKPKHTSCVFNFNYFAVVWLFCASQAFNHLWTLRYLSNNFTSLYSCLISFVSSWSFCDHWALSVHFDWPPWLLPIVLRLLCFTFWLLCVSLWSFDCSSWSLRSLSNHFAPLYSCSILFCARFGSFFCHLVFLWSLSSLYSFCMSSWLLSKALSLVCIIFWSFGRANRSF